MSNKYFKLLTSYFLLILCLAGCEQNQNPSIYKNTRPLMGTYVTITVTADSKEQAQKAIDAGFLEVERLEALLSLWRPDSELSRVNATAFDRPVEVSKELIDISKKSLEISQLTDGAFDPTIGPLVRLWNVTENKAPPDPEDVERARLLVDYRNVIIKGSTIHFLKKGITFDPGGIAKGYTADRVVALLKNIGIKSGIVAIAGDIKVFGAGGKGEGQKEDPWQVGIQDPRGEGLIASVELLDGAISTSGDYERYFIFEGRRYHHLLDPATGYPAKGIREVSVLDKQGVNCDGLATGLFVLGPERAKKKMENMNLAGLIVTETGEIYLSPAAKQHVKILPTMQ